MAWTYVLCPQFCQRFWRKVRNKRVVNLSAMELKCSSLSAITIILTVAVNVQKIISPVEHYWYRCHNPSIWQGTLFQIFILKSFYPRQNAILLENYTYIRLMIYERGKIVQSLVTGHVYIQRNSVSDKRITLGSNFKKLHDRLNKISHEGCSQRYFSNLSQEEKGPAITKDLKILIDSTTMDQQQFREQKRIQYQSIP